MMWYFLTNQEILFMFFSPRSFQFSIFSISSILKKNFSGPLARATSLYIRKTFRGPPKTGSRAISGPRANTLVTPGVS